MGVQKVPHTGSKRLEMAFTDSSYLQKLKSFFLQGFKVNLKAKQNLTSRKIELNPPHTKMLNPLTTAYWAIQSHQSEQCLNQKSWPWGLLLFSYDMINSRFFSSRPTIFMTSVWGHSWGWWWSYWGIKEPVSHFGQAICQHLKMNIILAEMNEFVLDLKMLQLSWPALYMD